MADDGEHRMVFDMRGRRKNVVKVVYAILAVLMGASLFLTVGPLSIGDIFNGQSGADNSALIDQADKAAERLVADPQNTALQLAVVRARVTAGNGAVQVDQTTGQQQLTDDAIKQYDEATAVWKRYLASKPAKPNSSVAQLAANAYITLAQAALADPTTSGTEATTKLTAAAQALGIVAKTRPSAKTAGDWAYFSYFAGDFKTGDKAAKQAESLAPKAQQKSTKTQLTQARTQAKMFVKQQAAVEKAQQQGKAGSQLQNPLGGLSGGGLGSAPAAP